MWKLLILLVLAGGGAAYWWTNRDTAALQAAADAKILRAEKELGIRQMLGNHGTFTFSSIVLDLKGPDGAPEFRGQLRSQETLVAAYGQLRGRCEADFARAGCWEIALLEADGRPIELDTAPELPGTPDQPATGAEGAETTPAADASPAPESPDAAAPSSGADTATTADPAPVSATPQATHRVTRERINSRTGPGTSNPVVTQLTEDTQIRLLETRSGWGQFAVMSGPAEGETVWIALSLTAPL